MRYNIGNVYNANSNIRDLSKNHCKTYTTHINDMSGEGIQDYIDTVKQVYNTGKKVLDFATGETGTALRNMIPSSDNTARDGFPGELHGILRLKNGKMGVANYLGPGTNLIKRLKRQDPGRTEIDRVAMGHDVRYALSTNLGDIRRADNIMIGKVNQISKNKSDRKQNIIQAKLINAKVKAENIGILKKDAFAGHLGTAVSLPDKQLLNSNLRELEQAGYGYPGSDLKKSLIKQFGKTRGHSKNVTMKGMKPHKLSGSGLGLPGGGLGLPGGSLGLPGGSLHPTGKRRTKRKKKVMKGKGMKGRGMGQANIHKFVSHQIIPHLMGELGLKSKISNQKILSHLTKVMPKTMTPASITKYSKIILATVLGSMKNKRGSGMPSKKIQTFLLKHLKSGLVKSLGWFASKGQGGSGLKLAGQRGGSFGSFFSGFKKGFKSTFQLGAKILTPLSALAGQPEIGVALTAGSKLLDLIPT